jgi:hypothetical protein
VCDFENGLPQAWERPPIWDAAKAVSGRSVSEWIQHHVCLGFTHYEHDAMATNLGGFDRDDLNATIENLFQLADVPPSDKVKNAMALLKNSTNSI